MAHSSIDRWVSRTCHRRMSPSQHLVGHPSDPKYCGSISFFAYLRLRKRIVGVGPAAQVQGVVATPPDAVVAGVAESDPQAVTCGGGGDDRQFHRVDRRACAGQWHGDRVQRADPVAQPGGKHCSSLTSAQTDASSIPVMVPPATVRWPVWRCACDPQNIRTLGGSLTECPGCRLVGGEQPIARSSPIVVLCAVWGNDPRRVLQGRCTLPRGWR